MYICNHSLSHTHVHTSTCRAQLVYYTCISTNVLQFCPGRDLRHCHNSHFLPSSYLTAADLKSYYFTTHAKHVCIYIMYVFTNVCVHVHVHVHVCTHIWSWVRIPPEAANLKMTVSGELCCVALPFCCLLLLLPCLSQHLFD